MVPWACLRNVEKSGIVVFIIFNEMCSCKLQSDTLTLSSPNYSTHSTKNDVYLVYAHSLFVLSLIVCLVFYIGFLDPFCFILLGPYCFFSWSKESDLKLQNSVLVVDGITRQCWNLQDESLMLELPMDFWQNDTINLWHSVGYEENHFRWHYNYTRVIRWANVGLEN